MLETIAIPLLIVAPWLLAVAWTIYRRGLPQEHAARPGSTEQARRRLDVR